MASHVLIWGSDRSSPHAVIQHGTLLTFGDIPTDFDVFINDDLARIRFEFWTDSAGIRLQYLVAEGTQGSKTNPPTVTLRFFNVTGTGTFTDGPVRIGTVGGIALWLCYEVAPALGSRLMKRIHYTLWDGSAPDVPQQLIPAATGRG
jgi:hypothetical protein